MGVRCRWHGGLVADKTYVSSNDADESGFDDDTQEDGDEDMKDIECDELPELNSRDRKDEDGGGGMGGGGSMPIAAWNVDDLGVGAGG